MATPPRIVVIGSINMDLVCRTPVMPKPGETILGSGFQTLPGGKGANQAVAAAKLGGEVHMVGRVGDDDFGSRLLNGLANHNVDTSRVTITEGVSTGIASIVVDKTGENAIIVVPGANHKLTPADIDAAESLIASAAVILLQLEIPLATVQHVLAIAQRRGIYTVLDPAPVPPKGLPRAMYGVDVLAPNQREAEQLLGVGARAARVKRKGVEDPVTLAADLLSRGPANVVLKLGNKGSMLVARDGDITKTRPFKVKVVDTTAAGDAFAGALAVGRAEGQPLRDAVRFANAAGAVCCRNFGAQPALPSRADVEELLRRG
jgi:ribokinase